MAKINKSDEVVQSAEYPESLIPVKVRKGTYVDKEKNQRPWVNLECVDELVYSNAHTLGIDPEDLPTITVKVKKPDSRDWEKILGEVISTSSAIVVPVIKNNQLAGLALSMESTDL
ncbi:hypothetical protein [Streptococcus suis]|uniref:hypothetical protein n=1 Tax=Streptococcus suis TaxID=1307 RepID=UPI0015576442|nr:hypothetical protein [Streptococcus suis]HEM5087576.1 hypothetical protein [Streptococcus suis]HEM5287635.1 hypothetical protein [Streptococcus suis]HEM5297713.1 hypothetical protein [Streptococcus suis]HEM5466813.1 hypothetical protein [Streptococcus suis]